MNSQTAFLAGFVLSAVTVFVTTAYMIWIPRLKHLMLERNIWRNRALMAEDHSQHNIEPDIKLVGEWGTAIHGWDDNEQP